MEKSCTHVATSEVTTLKHELGDHSMELGSFVSEAILSGAEMLEVFARIRGNVVVEFEVDTAGLICNKRK